MFVSIAVYTHAVAATKHLKTAHYSNHKHEDETLASNLDEEKKINQSPRYVYQSIHTFIPESGYKWAY